LIATKHGNVPTKSWRGKSAVFRMQSSLTSHGSSKKNNAVGRQRNLGLHQDRFSRVSTSTDAYKYSFIPRTITVWNRLPQGIIQTAWYLKTSVIPLYNRQSAKNIDICIKFMGRTKTKPFLKWKKVPKLYFHFWPPKKCPLFFFLIHTWWCENITASPCGCSVGTWFLTCTVLFVCLILTVNA
jgi:hypothetical protein